ncbi:unnamed protein product [Ranitomeya imitator]|uniref:MSP domain-containing protein n=1 Tax=Ranitomeya imitator TaxID=111125 RepID=A0ABN9KVW0_9NEOB|nr:unnamed protein product [Ranitomeya imitator]
MERFVGEELCIPQRRVNAVTSGNCVAKVTALAGSRGMLHSSEDHFKHDESEKADAKPKNRKTSSVFKGPFLHISPAEELHFGSKESGERKCVIILNNVTKNTVAFKVRTTAPDKFRVKPSNSSCEPGSTVDIVVSLHAASTASLQDRFLVMAAEMEQSTGTGAQELAQFWKEVPRNKVMEHRFKRFRLRNTRRLLKFNEAPTLPLNRR